MVAPPEDQASSDRIGVLYMVRIEDDTDLVPVEESPVLKRLGLLEQKITDANGNPVKAGQWVRQRVVKNLAATSSAKGDNEETDVEIVKGVKVKYYD